MPITLIATKFRTPFEPPYDTPEHEEACNRRRYNLGLYDPYPSISEAKAAAESHAGKELAWYERATHDGLNFHPWRGEPHLCAWNGTAQYLITDGICWMGWSDDPALKGTSEYVPGAPAVRVPNPCQRAIRQ
jgi:hypothetical protein